MYVIDHMFCVIIVAIAKYKYKEMHIKISLYNTNSGLLKGLK